MDAKKDELERKAKIDEGRRQIGACMKELREKVAKGKKPSKDDMKKCSDEARAAMDAVDGKDTSDDDTKDEIEQFLKRSENILDSNVIALGSLFDVKLHNVNSTKIY